MLYICEKSDWKGQIQQTPLHTHSTPLSFTLHYTVIMKLNNDWIIWPAPICNYFKSLCMTMFQPQWTIPTLIAQTNKQTNKKKTTKL